MTELYLGMLSGTSMDGIDIATVDFSKETAQITASMCIPFPNDFRTACLQITNHGSCQINELGQLDHWAGELFADAVLRFLDIKKIAPKNIIAIGSHGQTIWHAPNAQHPFSMQIGDPNVIAVKTGITTVADFRRADIAAGGQGAPFAPAFHQAVFSDPIEERCIVNIGGISNVSLLQNNTVTGFDTGPGNCLMDRWVKQYYNIDYDQDGEIAKTGVVNATLLQACLADAYFDQPTPKSTGTEYFNVAWLKRKLEACGQEISSADVMATLLELTAKTISDEILQKTTNAKIYICGGGAYNSALLDALSKNLKTTVLTTHELGIDPSFVEAALFAWLAQQRLYNNPINLQKITGAKANTILGGIYGFI